MENGTSLTPGSFAVLGANGGGKIMRVETGVTFLRVCRK